MQLFFKEFVEALARVAEKMFTNESLTLKIAELFKLLIDQFQLRKEGAPL